MIPQSFVQELLGRVDVVEVVDRHVKLKRAGANYVACCPFHGEKTPSFTVSPTKQFYHCFGCGAHGTAIGFLIEYGGLGFVEAVKELAQGAGMQVPEIRSPVAERRAREGEDLHDVLLKAAGYYCRQLKESPAAIAYLKKRGLSGEIAKRFGIGYAPDGWQNLAVAFSDYEGSALTAAGLTRAKDDGRHYDVFRDRIMFPIVDQRGNIIGFGGRVLEAGEPKYLNSPETPLFEKGRELYGLYQARRAIREAGRVVVVEGYMDVVALAQAGVEYAVATLGTATTALHLQKLLRQADEIVFCFDGDGAGKRAAWRALEVSLPQVQDGKQVGFLFLPDGEDPDTFVRRHGKEEFEARLAAARPLSRFLLDELAAHADLATAEGRASCLHAAKPLLKQMQPNGLRLQITRELAELCRVTPAEAAELCELGGQAGQPVRAAPARVPARPVVPLVEQLLALFIACPQLAPSVSSAQLALLDSPEMAPVAVLVDALQESGAATTAALLEATRESDHGDLFREVSARVMTDTIDDETARAMLVDALNQLERPRVESEYQRLLALGPRDEGERQRFNEVFRRLRELKGVGGSAATPGR
jgi:DNA primase